VTSRADEKFQDGQLNALLASYARGMLSPPLHVLVASHLAIKPTNRKFVRTLEEVAAAELRDVEPVAIPDRDERLSAIFALDARADSTLNHLPSPGIDILPRPLTRYLGRTITDVPWKTLLPGVKEFRIEDNEDGEATLYWIKSGRKMPSHTHEGSEYTLVLKGAFSDLNGHYGTGDIAIADMDVDHRPIADEGEDCFCFAVTDAPLQLTGPIGRIVQKLFKKH
jgi:putative transcriptional regulator